MTPSRLTSTLLGALGAITVLTACSGSSSGGGGAGATPPGTGLASSGAAGAATAPGTSEPAATSTDWTMYHGTPDHAGYSAAMPAASGAPRRIASIKLDAAVYASPIVVGGLRIVATENDTVYGLDSSYRQVWKTSLGEPSPQSERPCGDITPLGITGTPVYSATTKLVYVVAQHGGTIRHELVAFSPTTGAVKFRKGLDLPGADATVMQQRGALAVSGGRVFVPFGALAGDCGNYKGRVVSVALDGSGAATAFDPSPRKQGGVWNPAGGTVDADGNLLFVSANGSAFPGDAYDHTNSVNRINPAGTLLDSFAPTDWAENNQGDVGLGSNGVALVGTRWAVLGGKSGPVYVLDQGKLGGIGGQMSVTTVCKVFGGSAVVGSTVYLPCSDTGNKAVRVSSTGTLTELWTASDAIHGSPVVGGGRVWSLDQSGGTLYALDPATGKSRGSVSVGETSRFATPAITGPDVLVPTLTGLTVVRTS